MDRLPQSHFLAVDPVQPHGGLIPLTDSRYPASSGVLADLDNRSDIPYVPAMRPVFADPKTDIIFKKIFGEKAHKGLLIDLLNALLELDATHRIVDIEYLSPEQMPARKSLKLSILDVKCTDAQGTRYVVEMQVIEVEGFQKRVVFNACKAYSTQLGVGDDYPKLNDVIAVTICDFILWQGRDEQGWEVPLLSRWQMQEQHRGKRGLPEVQYVFLELPKYGEGSKPRSVVEKWTYLFRAASTLRRIPAELSEGSFGKALEVARTSNLSEEEWMEYEREKMAEQDYRGGLTLAERHGLEKGEKLGMEKGEKLGMEKGEKLGMEKGEKLGRRTELLESIEEFWIARFGPLPAGVAERLRAVEDLGRLKGLRTAVIQAQDRAEAETAMFAVA